MQPFERQYANLVRKVLTKGAIRATRNADTYALFGQSLEADLRDGFPILQGRKLYHRGVFGELAAMLRQPKCVDDFKKWGCNYWGLWANAAGELNVDYGNQWFNFNGFDQVAALKDMLANDPTNRRMIISSWRPDRLGELSLPCCHYSYQFFVEDNVISMVWTQRSVDTMIGLPSDMLFAAAWLMAIANEFGFEAGRIKMDFGDTHIYTSHYTQAKQYLDQCVGAELWPVTAVCRAPEGKDFCEFEPDDIDLLNYHHAAPINFELHG